MIAILDNSLVKHRPNGGEGLEQEQHQTHKLSNKHSLQNLKNPSLSRFLATEAYQESSKKPKKPPKKYKKNTKDN